MNLIKVELKKNFKGSIIWGIVLSGVLLLYMAFFPSMSDTGFSKLLEAEFSMMPQSLLEAFGLTEMPDFSVFMEYYGYVFQFIVIGLAIYAMILGTKSLSKEEGDKTIEFLYSKAITRGQIVLSKMIAAVVSILIVSILMVIFSMSSDLIFGDGTNILMIVIVNLLTLIPVFVYLAIGFAISSILKDDSKSMTIALGLFFGTYLMGIIANTIEQLNWLKFLSPINYNTAADIFKYFDGRLNATLSFPAIIVSVIIIVGGTIVTFVRYNKKDLLN